MIETKVNNGIKIIKFNNPRKKNAIAREDYEKLTHELNSAATDEAITIVVLTGTGDFYSSGNDFPSFMQAATSDRDLKKSIRAAIFDCMVKMAKAIYSFPKLLIAVVNGPAIGITATTLALCDVIYCANTAYFYTPFTKLGLCAEGCSSYTFPRILGTSKASEMLMMNHKMTAQEALQFNFVSKLYDPKTETESIWREIESLADLSQHSIKTTKALVKKFDLKILEETNQREANQLLNCLLKKMNVQDDDTDVKAKL